MKHLFILTFILNVIINADAQNVGIGTTTPQAKLSVGTNSPFQVDSVGNIKRINNVPYSFPAIAGGNNQFLKTSASGNLSWSNEIPPGTILYADGRNAGLEANGCTLIGRSSTEILDTFWGYKNGEWSINTLPNIDISNGVKSNFRYITNSGEIAYYTNSGTLKFYNPVTGSTFTSSVVALPDFEVNRQTSIVFGNGNVYVIGGANTVNNYTLKTCAKCDIITGVWSALPNLPDSLSDVLLSFDAGDIYVVGGIISTISGLTYSKKIYKYNQVANIWSELPFLLPYPIDLGIYDGSCEYKAGNLYLIGGIWVGSPSVFTHSLIKLNTNTGLLMELKAFNSNVSVSLSKDIANTIWGTTKGGINNNATLFFRLNPSNDSIEYHPISNIQGIIPGGNNLPAYWKNNLLHVPYLSNLSNQCKDYIFDPNGALNEVWGDQVLHKLYIYKKE